MQGDGTMFFKAEYLNIPESDNNSAIELITTMLNWDPNGRPTTEEILNSTFFRRSPGQLQENPQGKKYVFFKINYLFN